VAATLTAALPDLVVIGYEPPALTRGVVVTVSSAGIDPTEWLLAVRVYVSGLQPLEAQNLLDQSAVRVDAALNVPRSDWDFEWDDTRGAFLASTTIQYPREDF
jgi:hypothetical protein